MQPEKSYYHCTSEWHFSRLIGRGSEHVPLVYGLSLRLSKDSGVFSASVPHLCDYFSADQKSIRAALHLIETLHFFEFIRAERGASITYLPVRHSDWAKKYPGKCCQKEEKSFLTADRDPLAVELCAISGGKFRPFANFIKGMRKHGHSDAEICEFFREFQSQWKPTGRQWNKGFAGAFNNRLRDLASQPPAVAGRA